MKPELRRPSEKSVKHTARENFLSLIKRSNREKTHVFVKVQAGFFLFRREFRQGMVFVLIGPDENNRKLASEILKLLTFSFPVKTVY